MNIQIWNLVFPFKNKTKKIWWLTSAVEETSWPLELNTMDLNAIEGALTLTGITAWNKLQYIFLAVQLFMWLY